MLAQFGNNWMKKIPRTAKIGRGRRPSLIWLSEEFFEFFLLINYIASQLLGIEDITRGREDMNFMLEWQELYLTSERITRT